MQKWFQKRGGLAALMGALLISGLAGCAYPADGYYGNYPGYPAYAGDDYYYYYGYYDPWFSDFYWPTYYGPGWGFSPVFVGNHDHHDHDDHHHFAHDGRFHHGHPAGGAHMGATHGGFGGGGHGGGHGR